MERYLLKKISSFLNLSNTDIEILNTLAKEKKLLLSEICQRIKRSKRHVHQRLHMLISKGILKKEIEVLRNKRLAYKYSLRSIRNIVDELKIRLLKIINELEEFVD